MSHTPKSSTRHQVGVSPPDDNTDREIYYGFRGIKMPRMLFVRPFGSGSQYAAQVVRDLDRDVSLIRRVNKVRLRRDPKNKNKTEFLPLQPWGIATILRLQKIEASYRKMYPRRFNPWMARCYDHQFIESKSHQGEETLYSSVSYWKLYNGGTFTQQALENGEIHFPVAAIARMAWQVLSTLDFLYRAPEKPISHRDLKLSNIFIHWDNQDSRLPNFFVGDWDTARPMESLPEKVEDDDDDGSDPDSPVVDLVSFSSVLEDIIKSMKPRWDLEDSQAEGDRFGDRLGRIRLHIVGAVAGYRGGPPPDLRHLAWEAKTLEKDCMNRDRPFNELSSAAYEDLIKVAKVKALARNDEKPFSVFGRIRHALNPRDTSRAPNEHGVYPPMVIYGPWQLVHYATASSGRLLQSDGPEFLTHSRPNDPLHCSPPQRQGSDTGLDLQRLANESEYVREAKTADNQVDVDNANSVVFCRLATLVSPAEPIHGTTGSHTGSTPPPTPVNAKLGGKGKEKEGPSDSEDGFDTRSLLSKESESIWTERLKNSRLGCGTFGYQIPKVYPLSEGIPNDEIPFPWSLPVANIHRANKQIPISWKPLRGSKMKAQGPQYDGRLDSERVHGPIPSAHTKMLDVTPQQEIEEAEAASKQNRLPFYVTRRNRLEPLLDPAMPKTEEEWSHFHRQFESWYTMYEKFAGLDKAEDEEEEEGEAEEDAGKGAPLAAPMPAPWEVETPAYPVGEERDTAEIFGEAGKGLRVARVPLKERADPDLVEALGLGEPDVGGHLW